MKHYSCNVVMYLCLLIFAGSVTSGCSEGDQLLPQSEAAHHRCCGEHEWLCVSKV